jgi:DNA helicase IV
LEPLARRYQNQILVDEATDFSPLQLACMAGLCHPDTRSFFACGDFNQRLTTWGTRSREDLSWAVGDIDIREIKVSYRQSRQLNDLARAIIEAAGGVGDVGVLPKKMDSEGVEPALLESVDDSGVVIDWLGARIREIERFVGQLPSTAIFVNEESEVQPTADALNMAMAEYNIQVSACPQGQVMGNDNDVRVFAVEHIKGLEFEAVFFIGVDRLADLQPELFDKYLYVGTTRAATYLGITCDNLLPDAISGLKDRFVPTWESAREGA